MVEAATITAILGITGTAATITAIIVNIAISALLGKILAPDAPPGGRDTKGLQTTIRSNIAPRRVCYGEAVTGGPYAYLETEGASNEYLRFIVVLTTHPIEDVLGIFLDDEYVDISGAAGSNDLSSSYYINTGKFGTNAAVDHVRVIKNLGWGWADKTYVDDETTFQDALDDQNRASIISNDLVVPDKWGQPLASSRDSGTGLYGTGHKLTNCAYVYVSLKFNKDVWSGIPAVKFHIKGKRLYNPSLDSSLVEYGADSAGTHDLNNGETWEWSENWGLACLDFLIDTKYGISATTSGTLKEVRWDGIIDAINDSGELVTQGFSSGSIDAPRYTINGIFETSGTPISIMESLLASGAGALLYSQGQYGLRAGVYKPPSSDDDIINEDMIVSPLTIRTHTGRNEVFNKVAGVYVEKEDKNGRIIFEPGDFPIVDPPDSTGLNPYETIDGEEIIKEVDYPFCIYEHEAQRLAKILLERVRRGLLIQFNANLEVLKYSVGSNVYLEILSNGKYSNEVFFNRLGLDSEVQPNPNSPFDAYYKQFKILDLVYNPDMTIGVTLLEEDEELYDWNDGDASSTDYALVSELVIDDPTGTVLPPSFIVGSPYDTINEVSSSESGTTITTLLRWTAPERGSTINAIDRAHINSYRLEYGVVTNPSEVGEARVDTWIFGGLYVADPDRLTQGPASFETLYKASTIEYDFRLKATTYNGRSSEWVYYSQDIGSDYSPAVPPTATDTRFYIKPLNGTAIKNSSGELTVEARIVTAGSDDLIVSGDVKLYVGATEVTVANGYQTPSDGYTGVFDANNISNSVVVELRDDVVGILYDSITLVDVTDGTAGDDAVYGYIEPSNGLAWTRATNDGAWSPSATDTDLDVTFVQGGVEVARRGYRVTRDNDGNLTGAATDHSNTNLNESRITIPISGSGTSSLTVSFIYSFESIVSTVAETVITAQSGDNSITGSLSNEAHTVAAASDGTGYSLDNAGGNYRVWDGKTDVTGAGPVYSVVGGEDTLANSVIQVDFRGASVGSGSYTGPARNYRNTSLVLTEAAANTSRFESGIDGIVQGFLAEPSVTDYLPRNNDLTHADWGGVRSTLTQPGTVADIEGGTNGFLFNDGTETGTHNRSLALVGVPDNSPICGIAFVKPASGIPYANMMFATKNGDFPTARFDFDNGRVGSSAKPAAATIYTHGMRYWGGGYYLCWFAVDSDTGATTPKFFIGSADSTQSPSYTGANNTMHIAYCAVQSGFYSKLPFATTTGNESRTADTLTYASSNQPANNFVLDIAFIGGDSVHVAGTPDTRYLYESGNFSITVTDNDIVANFNGNTLTYTGTIRKDQSYSVRVRKLDTGAYLYVNGVLAASNTGASYQAAITPGTIYIGSDSSGANQLGSAVEVFGIEDADLGAQAVPSLKVRAGKDPGRNNWAIAGTENNKDAAFVRDTITLDKMTCLIVRFYWGDLETTAGTYDLSLIDGLLDACAEKQTFLKILPMWRRFNTFDDVMPADLVADNQYSVSGGYCSPVYETDVRTRYQDLCTNQLIDTYKDHPWFAGIQTNETSGMLDSPTDTYTLGKMETEMNALLTNLSAHCPYVYIDFYWNFLNGAGNVTAADTAWDNIFNGLEGNPNIRLATPDILADPATNYGAINDRVYPFFTPDYQGSVGYFGGTSDGTGRTHIIQSFTIGSSFQFDSYRWDESNRTLLELFNFGTEHLGCQFVIWTWTSITQSTVTLEYEDNGEVLDNTSVLIAEANPTFAGAAASGGSSKNGLTISVNSSSGVYSLSGPSWTSDKETFALRTEYAGVSIDRVYSVSKSKAGTSGTNGTNGEPGSSFGGVNVKDWEAYADFTDTPFIYALQFRVDWANNRLYIKPGSVFPSTATNLSYRYEVEVIGATVTGLTTVTANDTFTDVGGLLTFDGSDADEFGTNGVKHNESVADDGATDELYLTLDKLDSTVQFRVKIRLWNQPNGAISVGDKWAQQITEIDTANSTFVQMYFNLQAGQVVIWKGALASAPSNPVLNWAYYNTTDGVAYIWDGDSWETLSADGTDGLDGAGMVNPGFELGNNKGWEDFSNAGTVVNIGADAHRGSWVMRVPNGAVGPDELSNRLDIGPGERVLVGAYARRDQTWLPDNPQQLLVRFYDADDTQLQMTSLQTASNSVNTWQFLRGVATAPANAANYVINLGGAEGSGRWWWDDVFTILIPRDIDLESFEGIGALIAGASAADGSVLRSLARGPETGSVSDGDVVTFSVAWTNTPIVRFTGGGKSFSSTLSGSQLQEFQALNLSGSSFTAKLKLKEETGATTLHTDSTVSTPSSPSGLDASINKSQTDEAHDDKYTFQYDITFTNPPGEPDIITVGFYTDDGSGWVQRATASHIGDSSDPDIVNATKTVVADGLGLNNDFGMHKETVGTGHAFTFDNVKYETAAVGASEAATPPKVDYIVLGG